MNDITTAENKKRVKFEVRPGFEIRGMMIRLYPLPEQVEQLKNIESSARVIWNWLCSQTDDVLQARAAYAIRNGLVEARPIRPNYDELKKEECKAAKDEWLTKLLAWYGTVKKATDKVECCAYRPSIHKLAKELGFTFDYQMLRAMYSPRQWGGVPLVYEQDIQLNSSTVQAIVKNYYTKSKRKKKRRKHDEPMPLQTRTGDCFSIGQFGARGKNKQFYNCQVMFNGIKIRGRLPSQAPWGRVLEGVSITKQADGWWASIKQEVPIRQIPDAVPGSVIGIDAGLDFIAVFSDGTFVDNPREKEYSERIAGRQALGKPVGRIQQKMARHVKHLIYNEIIKPLAEVETIKVENLVSTIGQMGSRKTSSMRTAVMMLRDRYGNRVREVDCRYTSQDCSQCGHRSKDSWSYQHGRMGECPVCGHRQDRDLNAARNIAAREPLPLGS